MKKIMMLSLFSLLLFSEELEVRLQTRKALPPIYISMFQGAENMRDVLKFDLNASGHCAVIPRTQELEANVDPFNFSNWKREKIPYCLSAKIDESGHLELIAYDIERGISYGYADISLQRNAIHELADAILRDLFQKQGIASLKLIYTERTKNPFSDGLDFLSEIWISDADGANPRQVTLENSYCLCPNFLPDSNEEFFYASEKSGQTKIYRASIHHPKGELLVNLRGNQALPAMRPDGKQIAFISDIAGRPDLFIQNLGPEKKAMGKPKQIFSAPRATQASPTYSPDGSRIAFVSDKDGPPRIYLMNLNDKRNKKPKPRLLTRRNRENTSPSWSPDGTKLAYSARVEGVRQIWIYDFKTGEEIPLTAGPENKENPSWAPDSFHLIYNTEGKDLSNLYLINLNRTEPIPIAKSSVQKRFASWQRLVFK